MAEKINAINNIVDNSAGLIDTFSAISGLAEALEDNIYYTGRVKNIVLDENSRGFQTYGEWNGLGTIEFEFVNDQKSQTLSLNSALPLFSNIQNFPLVEELVLIFRLPSTDINTSTNDKRFFYLNPISLWNHPHHNALPNPIQGQAPPSSQQKDYTAIGGGSARRVTDESTEIDLNKESGGTFREQTNIHPILPFAGDVIVEGRFGNSLRLGNTANTDSNFVNNWSSEGENGNPITILRNGQPDDASRLGWLPITENINNDKASIYLTSNQKIPINTDGFLTSAFEEAPTQPSEYTSNQILLNSGRLVLNSYADSVIISANQSVSISSIEELGLTSNSSISLESGDILLGGPSANYNLVRGQELLSVLKRIVQALNILSQGVGTLAFDWPGGAAAPSPLQNVGNNVNSLAQSISKILDQPDAQNILLSQVSKTT